MRKIVIEMKNKHDRPIFITSERRGRVLSVSIREFGTSLILLLLLLLALLLAVLLLLLFLKSIGFISITFG